MQRFTDLKVWQRGQKLALEVYRVTKQFPPDERFGLTSQLRRAALSVSTNIAEGSKRRTSQDYARFLNLAEASLAEVESLVLISGDLGYLHPTPRETILSEADELARMLNSLRARVENNRQVRKKE